tara:strand:- start:35368 stop:35835 length:468 start_codon:yes stop_codon:yes gene_type:complete
LSGARARANHELYLGKIVIAAWRRELAREDVPAATLAQAFHAGVRNHLVAAYGWFLLAVSQAEVPPQGLPQSCQELPPMPEGRVYPPEINEFRQLETSGWLFAMLHTAAVDVPGARQPGNLALSTHNARGTEQVEHWLQQLEDLFERMGDSLDEY